MPWSSPNSPRRAEPLVARRGRDHRRAGALRELDRGEADAAGAGLDEHRLARVQVAELEEAVVGGAERDRARTRPRSMSAPSGIGHVTIAGTATSSACEPQSIVATTRWPTWRSVTPSPTSRIVPAHW